MLTNIARRKATFQNNTTKSTSTDIFSLPAIPVDEYERRKLLYTGKYGPWIVGVMLCLPLVVKSLRINRQTNQPAGRQASRGTGNQVNRQTNQPAGRRAEERGKFRNFERRGTLIKN